ncbi:putative c6 transcription protein [Rosellinia necatrix]|uniref:Putative c6 transcription protein n=1 Tax=Rosellinia necatrix TaxID=77044 RepID=A0A1W2TFT0_ROSNE|nr:putative c6 transcription protein [Rosellinia necatrix]
MDVTPRTSHGQRRRQRPTLACISCRKSKIRCDRQQPCGACTRSRHRTCVFDTLRGPASRRSGIASLGADRAGAAETEHRSDYGLAPVTPASSTPTAHGHDGDHGGPYVLPPQKSIPNPNVTIADANELLMRLFRLERRLDESTTSREPPEKHDQRNFRPEGLVIESYLAADIHAMSRGVVSKTRYFGQSHWMNGVIHFKSMLELFEHQSKDAKSEAMAVLNRCKAIGRSLKAQRSPGIINKLGTNIPPKEVADKLVDGYIRTIETVFRVLHIPSFRRDYEQYWAAPDAADMSFVIQLQLVMAIGCTIYDDFFSMRKSAVQWVTEAQYWLLGPPAKGKLTIAGLQIMILLALARETAAVGGDLVWIHVGSLLRSAFYMGLHRDPSRLPKMSRLDAEIRRRLWNTILELELKSSIDSGGFPMISPDTSDTRAPADVDDESLLEDSDAEGTESSEKFTDMSIALALRESFRERLAIYQMLNATPFRGTYDDTIQLHRRFMTGFKALMKKIKGYTSSERQPTPFQCRLTELIARRCLMSLHLPYLGPGLKDPAYSFSRKQVTDSSVKMYYLLFPPAAINSPRSLIPSGDDLEVLSTEGDDLSRFAICAAGFWRILGSQPSMIATLELQTSMQEDDGLGPPTLRPDLLAILQHSLPYYLTRIKAGETNVKGYLFTTALAAHVHALMNGLTGPKTLEPILSAAIRTERTCFDILRQQLGSAEHAEAGTGEEQFDWDALMTANEEWGDNVVAGSFFDVSSVECFLGADSPFDFLSPPMSF